MFGDLCRRSPELGDLAAGSVEADASEVFGTAHVGMVWATGSDFKAQGVLRDLGSQMATDMNVMK